jgi:hypothetical protein
MADSSAPNGDMFSRVSPAMRMPSCGLPDADATDPPHSQVPRVSIGPSPAGSLGIAERKGLR